jgi:hypothetical protein
MKVMVDQPEALEVTLPAPDYDQGDTIVVIGENLQIKGGVAPYSYEWSYDNGAITSDSSFTAKLDSSEVFTLTVTDARGCYDTRSISVSVVSYISSPLDKMINVYPVPATSFIQVDLPVEMQQTRLVLIDFGGSVIWQKQLTGRCRIPLSYDPGVYFLKIKSREHVSVRRIIIR